MATKELGRCKKGESPILSDIMMAASTSTAPTTNSISSNFSPAQQEKALRDVQGRLLVVKRVLSAVKREPPKSSAVLPIDSSTRRLKVDPGSSALSPSDESAEGNHLEQVSFHLSCSTTSAFNAGVTRRNNDERMIQLFKGTSLSPSERKVRFHGKNEKSKERIDQSGGTMAHPSTLCNSGVNPKTRLPYPPPVRPLPLAERGGSSPVAVEVGMLSSRRYDQMFGTEHNRDHAQHGTNRGVAKLYSPNSIVENSEEALAWFNSYEPSRLPDPPILTPTMRKKSRNPNRNDLDHVIDDFCIPTRPIRSTPSVTDESSVMATTKSVFPQRQDREDRKGRLTEIRESDTDSDTLQCSNHWNSFPQPKKTTTKSSRRISKSASFSAVGTQLPSSLTSRRYSANRRTFSSSSTPTPSAMMKLIPSKVPQQESNSSSSKNVRRVKSELQWKSDEKRLYKPLNSL